MSDLTLRHREKKETKDINLKIIWQIVCQLIEHFGAESIRLKGTNGLGDVRRRFVIENLIIG